MEDRIIDLEIKFTHQEKIIDELNEVIIEQGKEIIELKKKIKLLKDSFDQQLVKNEEEEVPPPHY